MSSALLRKTSFPPGVAETSGALWLTALLSKSKTEIVVATFCFRVGSRLSNTAACPSLRENSYFLLNRIHQPVFLPAQFPRHRAKQNVLAMHDRRHELPRLRQFLQRRSIHARRRHGNLTHRRR